MTVAPARRAPLISVIIPCRNEATVIEECLESILEQQHIPGDVEVIVVDGLSDDGTRDILQAFSARRPEVRIVENPGRITPMALNIGVREAHGEWIARMDAHTTYAKDYLAECLAVARQTGADNVGGAVFATPTNYMQRAIAATHHSRFSSGGASWHVTTYEGPTESVWGGFWRRDTLIRLGLFDESLIRNQDDELNLRITASGGTIWQSPRIRCWYTPRSSPRELFQQYMQYGYWKVWVVRKHRGVSAIRHLVPTALLLSLGGSAIASAALALAHRENPSTTHRAAQSMMRRLFVYISGSYSAASLVASWRVASRAGRDLLPVLPVVFGAYHAGYGLGFLLGIVDAASRGKPRRTMAELTRG